MVGVALMQPAAYAADPATQDDIAGLQAQIDQLKKAQTHYFSVNGGTQGNNYSNDGAKSVNSIAIGVNAATGPKGNDAIAIGTNASAHYDGGPGPIAIGSDTKAHAQYAIAIGGGAEVSGTGGKGDQGIAIGRDARVDNAPGGVALGCDSYATNQSAIAIGSSAHAEELDTLAIGVGAKSYANSGMSMGSYSMAAGKFSIAQGFHSVANGSLSVALGLMATVYDSTTKLAAAEYKKLSPEEKAFYKYHTEGSNGQPDFYYRADMDNHGRDVTFYVDGTALGTYSTAQEKGTSVGALAMTSSFGSALGYRARALSVNSTAVGAYAITRAEDGVALGSYTLADRAAGVGGYNPGTGETYADDAAAAALFGKTTEVNALNGKIKEANKAIKTAATAVTAANKAVAADPENNAKRQALRAAETNYTKAVSERDNLIKEKGGLVGTWSSTLGAVSVGSLEGPTRRITRQITNVAAGSADTDAVNVAQLKALNGKVDANAVHYFSVNDGGARGSNYNNDGAKSVDSIAIGKSASASKANGIALGNGASINYDEAVAIGRGTRAGGVGSIALGGGAMIASNGYDMTSIAIGRQAYVLNGSGGQEYMLSFDQDNWTVSGGLFHRTYAPKDVSRIAGGIAIGAKAYARTGSIDIGSRVYPNDMAGEKAENLRPANIVNMTTVGTNSYNKGPFASIFGAYSIMTGDHTGAGGLNTLQYGAQNTGSVIVGSLNSNRSKGHDGFSGIANSIVGFANTVDNSNGALVYGAGNKITNSLKSLRGNPGAGKMKSVDAAAEAFRDMVASEEGGATLAIGGANTADYTQASQIIGVGNTLTGKEAAVSTNNMIDGYRNKGTNVSHVTIVGSNNTVEDSEDNILLGDNRKITAKSHNIVIGSAEKGSSSPLELNNENSVVLGYKANATADGGVALGSDSVADRAAFATETEAPFSKVKLNSTNTLGAVSVGQAGKLRQITNVGDATEDTDAVNLRQLRALNGKVDANAVHYFSVNDGGARGSNYNNDGAKSVDSIAIGKSASASKANGIALGNGASINYDEAVAIGRGTRAGGVGSIALGGGAMIASNGYDMTSIAIGRQAYVLNGSGGQEYMLSFDQDNWTVSGGLFHRTYAPKDVSRIAGGIAIGAKAYARTGSIDIGSRVYPNDMAGEKAENLRPANIVNMTTVGTNSYNKGPFASIFGAYSIMTGDHTGAGGLNTLQYGAQNTGSVIVGSLNSNRSKGHDGFSGIANSIVGFANTVDNSNGALVYGAGNKITNSLKSLRGNPGAGKMKSVDAAAEAFRDMVASEEGGATLAIGGANTADYTQASQIIGVGNTLTGKEAAVSTNNMIDGYRNKGTNVSHVTIVGSNNTVEDSEDNILLGDNRKITAKSHNIVIGSAEKGSSSPLELNNENSVVLGYKANATADGGVALGSDSVADRAAFATETEAPFSKVKLNSTNTLGAVSVGQAGKLRQITNVGDATEDTDAVNLRQLRAVGANLAGLSEFTFNFSNKKAGTVTNVGTTKLTDGALNIQAIDGLKIAYDRSAKLYTVGLDKDAIAADPTLHGKDGKDGKDGVGIDEAVINGDGHLIITKTDSTEFDAGEVKGKDGTDAKWKALVAKAIGTNGTASGSAQEIGADQQLTFEAGKNVDLKLAADGTAGSKLTIAVSENPTFKSVTTGDVTMNGDGLTVKNGPSVTKKGIDAGGKRITNVADGIDKSDAVNVGQLQRAIAEVGGADNGQIVKRVNELDSRVDNVGAMAAAFAAVPSLDYDEAHPTSLGLGYGAYSGKSAVALGLSHYVNRDLLIKGGMSISGDEKSFHLGAAIRLGSSPKVERTNGRTVRVSTTEMVALRQVSDLKDEVSKMSDGMAQQKKEIEELKKLLLNKK